MNILFLSCLELWSGGTKPSGAPSFKKTVDAYVQAGHSVYLVTNQNTSINYSQDELYILSVLKSKPRSVKIQKVLNTFIFPLAVAFKILRLSRDIKFDLIYGYESHGVIAGFIISTFLNVPLVSRFQGTVLHPIMQTGTLWQKITNLDHLLALKLPADLAIMTNDGTFGDLVLQQLNPTLAKKSVFWRNGVDFLPDNAFDKTQNIRQKLNISESTTVLMTVSRLVHWKRVDRAIIALPNILRYEEDVVLVVVGDGPERNNLERLAQQNEVTDHIVFAGLVDHKMVHHYIHIADIFLSLYDLSNVGNPLLEAMRHGKPIITINNGDTATVINHRVNGILINSGCQDTVAKAVLDLIQLPAMREKLGREALQYAEQNFVDWNTRLLNEIKLVTSLIEQ